jgi:hypothetical protein
MFCKDFLTPREYLGPPTCQLTTALVVGGTVAASAAASAGAQAASGGKGGSGGGQTPGSEATLWERLVNQDVVNIGNEERALIENAIGEGRLLAPEMYRALGLEPQYAEDPAAVQRQATVKQITDMEGQLSGLDQTIRGLQQQRAGAKPKQKKALNKQIQEVERQRINLASALAGARTDARSAGLLNARTGELESQLSELDTQRARLRAKKNNPAAAKRLKEINNKREQILGELAVARRDEGAETVNPYKIVGFKKIDGADLPADSPLSMQNPQTQILMAQQKRLLAALRGENPVDPTLLRGFEEKERLLHEQLSRQLGPDYAITTVGSDALRNLERERAEAMAQYNQSEIAAASGQQADQSRLIEDLLASRLEKTSYVPNWTLSMARNLEGPASILGGAAESARANRRMTMAGAPKESADEGNPYLAAALNAVATGTRSAGLSYLGTGAGSGIGSAGRTSQNAGVTGAALSPGGSQIPLSEDMY